MDITKYDGIVFDMDGVLFDTERIGLESWKIVANENGLKGIKEVALRCIGRSTVDTVKIITDAYGDIPIEDMFRRSSEIQRQLIEKNGMPIKTGAKELLAFLKDRGVKTGLASSTKYDGVVYNLEITGLLEYFSVIIGGNMIKHSKPSPEIYLTACQKLGVNPAKTFAVEDSINGIISAHRAGMMPILVPDIVKHSQETLDMSVAKFDNLLQVMDFFSK